MKRPTIPLMLLIAASIFVFFLLNLLLGSVSIPIGSVWNILWGGTDESVIWQNIIWKSRVPQALTALVAGAGLSVACSCRPYFVIRWQDLLYLVSVPVPAWEWLSWYCCPEHLEAWHLANWDIWARWLFRWRPLSVPCR
mgnify:CR=1 FL=1